MQSPDSTFPKQKRPRNFPAWLKVVITSFVIAFVVGFVGGAYHVERDSGKLGTADWHRDPWEAAQTSAFNGLLFGVPCSVISLAVFGCYRIGQKLVKKNT